MSIEWNLIRLGHPAHGIVTKTVQKTLQGGGGGLGVVGSQRGGVGGLTALFTKLPDGLPLYRMGSGGHSVWQFPIDILPFCRERPVTKELAAL